LFYRFKFPVSTSQIALTSSLMMSGPFHPTSIHWIIRFGGNAGVLTKAATEAKTSSRVLKCTLVNLVCITWEIHWQCCCQWTTASTAGWHTCLWLQVCVSASGGHFEHL